MLLTKSKFLIGLECPKCFWKSMHETKNIETSIQEDENVEQKKQLDELAKKLFNNIIDLSNKDFKSKLKATEDCLFLDNTIFKASIKVDNLYASIDLLVPNDDESYDVVEIKGSTNVKDTHIYEAAFKKYVCEKARVDIKKCHVIYLNSSYVKDGDINLEELFIKEDISDKVEEFYNNIPEIIEKLIGIYNLPEAPTVNSNKYLFKEYPCNFNSDCWSFLPKNNISKLYYIKSNKAVEYFRNNIFEIVNIPDNELNKKQLIQKRATINNKPYINKEGISKFISTLKYPLYYFDFETFNEAVPRFDKSKSYLQIPFQYSLHIQYENGRLEHHEFLHKDTTDPRELILKSMIDNLGDKGSVIVFNQSFEKARLRELSQLYPKYKTKIDSIIERITDLIIPFREFDYYNPIQEGSCSIKKVLPAVTGKSYSDMNISNGQDASSLYYKATFKNIFSKEEKEDIYRNLLKYCKLDTEGMVWIIDELKKIAFKD